MNGSQYEIHKGGCGGDVGGKIEAQGTAAKRAAAVRQAEKTRAKEREWEQSTKRDCKPRRAERKRETPSTRRGRYQCNRVMLLSCVVWVIGRIDMPIDERKP